MPNVPYDDAIRAYRQWSKSTGARDITAFLKFLGTPSLNKHFTGPEAICKIHSEAAQRIYMLLGPNAHAIIKMYLAKLP